MTEEQFKRVAKFMGEKTAQDKGMAEYYASMKSYAEEIIQEAKQQVADGYYGDVEEAVSDLVSQAADDSQWVIYTGNALDVLNYSENWLAIEDVEEIELTSLVTRAAYFAVEADIREQISRIGIDFPEEE